MAEDGDRKTEEGRQKAVPGPRNQQSGFRRQAPFLGFPQGTYSVGSLLRLARRHLVR